MCYIHTDINMYTYIHTNTHHNAYMHRYNCIHVSRTESGAMMSDGEAGDLASVDPLDEYPSAECAPK